MNEDRSNFGDVRTRLDWAKAGARAFADLQAGSGVDDGFISFASSPTTELDLRPIEADDIAGPDDHALTPFQDRIDDLEPNGLTAIGDTLSEARSQLNAADADDPTLQQRSSCHRRRADHGLRRSAGVAEAMSDDGIQIFAVPLGTLTDQEFPSSI